VSPWFTLAGMRGRASQGAGLGTASRALPVSRFPERKKRQRRQFFLFLSYDVVVYI